MLIKKSNLKVKFYEDTQTKIFYWNQEKKQNILFLDADLMLTTKDPIF